MSRVPAALHIPAMIKNGMALAPEEAERPEKRIVGHTYMNLSADRRSVILIQMSVIFFLTIQMAVNSEKTGRYIRCPPP